jgi:predicted metal-dependent peptidase
MNTQFDHILADDTLRLLDKWPFFGAYMASLSRKSDTTIETLCVEFNPKTRTWGMSINPTFYMGIPSQPKRIALLIHELLHVCLLHPVRVPTITPKANIAADIIVNEMIGNVKSRTGQREMPMREWFPDACFYEKFGLKEEADDTFERVMSRLKDDQPKGGKGQGNGQGTLDDHSRWDITQAEMEQAEAEARMITETVIASIGIGDLPESIKNAITEALQSKVKWTRHLKVFGQASIRTNYKWNKSTISRRFGMPFTGRTKRCGGKILVGVDVSGSVGEDDKKQFLGELAALTRLCEVEVCFFDTRIVRRIPQWKKGLPLPNTNGGTDPQAVFDYAAACEVRPSSIVLFTDGQFRGISTRGFKTLFVITKDGQRRSEGQTIELN